jgi:[acyl-carrier-protein] S-malonyltransferase
MGKTACVFPGQGSQTVGMGKELAAAFPAAKLVFQEVDDALNQKLSQIIFEGPEDMLTLTENAQPAIMATSMAFLRVLEKETGFVLSRQVNCVAGHSLGEYTALAAAGAITLADTARLLKTRGRAMQQAVPAGEGAMAAILGLEFDAVMEIVKEAAKYEICAVANDNAPGQVVVSGTAAGVDKVVELAKERGAKRAVPLSVSAPFHCPLMAPAAQVMQEALGKATIKTPSVPLVANVTAALVSDVDTIRKLLVEQVTGMVRWRESVQFMQAQGIDSIIEIGAGKVLSGLNKRIAPEINSSSIGSPQDIEAFVKAA